MIQSTSLMSILRLKSWSRFTIPTVQVCILNPFNLGGGSCSLLFSVVILVDVQKMLCQLLGQLQIGPGLDSRSIQKLNILLSNHEEVRSVSIYSNKIHKPTIMLTFLFGLIFISKRHSKIQPSRKSLIVSKTSLRPCSRKS